MWIEIQGAAKVLKVTPQLQEVSGLDEIEHAFASLVKDRARGLIVLPHAVTNAGSSQKPEDEP